MNKWSDSILSVYSDARTEYTKQLCVFLVPAYFQFFVELLEKAKEAMSHEPKRILWQFQNYLNETHDWNMEKVHHEIQNINTNSGCDYLEDLLTAVFIAHTKVLTAIRLSSNKKKIEINVPKVEHFLFKVLCETSKLLWSSSYLFRDGISAIEKQQNYRSIEQLINEGILQAIRSLVPVKSILKDFVNNDVGEDDSDSDDDKEDKPVSNKDTIPEPVLLPESELESEPEHKPEPTLEAEPEPEPEPVVEPVSEPKSDPVVEPSQTIIINDTPGVKFSEFDTVFDSDNPENSDLVYYPKDTEEEDSVPGLEIVDGVGVPLSEGDDFDDLDATKSSLEEENAIEYEEL